MKKNTKKFEIVSFFEFIDLITENKGETIKQQLLELEQSQKKNKKEA